MSILYSILEATCFNSFIIHPIQEFFVLHLTPTSCSIQLLESVQQCAARFCYNNFSPCSSITSTSPCSNLAKLATINVQNNLLELISLVSPLILNQRESRNGNHHDSYEYFFFPISYHKNCVTLFLPL